MTYLESIHKQFAYYKMLGDKTFAQLSDEALFWQYNKDSNSIGIIVKHLWGNMLSRWTDFRTSDGEKTWRQREAEFDADIKTRAELLEKWETGWQCLFDALAPLTKTDLEKLVYIRNQGHTISEAINRQMAHYAYHVGQIVFIGKMTQGNQWQSLSIARGQTATYNADKFGKGKRKGHFTDNFLEQDKSE